MIAFAQAVLRFTETWSSAVAKKLFVISCQFHEGIISRGNEKSKKFSVF
jgi:hypothetical protein